MFTKFLSLAALEVVKLTRVIIGSDNGLLPIQYHAII